MISEDGIKKGALSPYEKMTFNTGVSKYSFTQAWLENQALKDILVDLIAEDYSRMQNNDNG